MNNNLLQNSVNATFSQSQKFQVKAAAEKKEILNTVIRASRTRKQRKRNTARRLYYQTEEGKAQNDSRLNPEAPVFRSRPSFRPSATDYENLATLCEHDGVKILSVNVCLWKERNQKN